MFELNKEGRGVNRKRVRRLMRVMGIEALVPRPGTSKVTILERASYQTAINCRLAVQPVLRF
jgi:HTH-like domain